MPQSLEPRLIGLGIAHPAEPISQGVGIGDDFPAYQLHQGSLLFQLPQVLQGLPASLEHQDQALHEGGGGIAPVAAANGQTSIHQLSQSQPMVELPQKG